MRDREEQQEAPAFCEISKGGSDESFGSRKRGRTGSDGFARHETDRRLEGFGRKDADRDRRSFGRGGIERNAKSPGSWRTSKASRKEISIS
jgi:hypothetical protein